MIGLMVSGTALTPLTGQAQSGQIELRLDALHVLSQPDVLSVALRAPGSAAVAWYLTPALAIDARLVSVGYQRIEVPDGRTRTTQGVSVAATGGVSVFFRRAPRPRWGSRVPGPVVTKGD